jgi:hypothetical protein
MSQGIQSIVMQSKSTSHTLLLTRLFDRMRACGIPFVVLHSYENLPGCVESDVDLATSSKGIEVFPKLIRQGISENQWVALHLWKHEICAYGCLLADRKDLSSTLLIDICSDYVANRRFILPSEQLLLNRKAYGSFYIPSHASEAAYLLAKGVVKKKERKAVFPRLQKLRDQCPEELVMTCAGVITSDKFSSPCRSLEEIENVYDSLTSRDLGRTYHPFERMLEFARLIDRALHPRGVHVAIISPNRQTALKFAELLQSHTASYFMKNMVIDSHDHGACWPIFRSIVKNLAYVHLVLTIWSNPKALAKTAMMTAAFKIHLDALTNQDEVLVHTENEIVRLLIHRF